MLLVKEAKSPLNITTTLNCKFKMYRRSGTGQSSFFTVFLIYDNLTFFFSICTLSINIVFFSKWNGIARCQFDIFSFWFVIFKKNDFFNFKNSTLFYLIFLITKKIIFFENDKSKMKKCQFGNGQYHFILKKWKYLLKVYILK